MSKTHYALFLGLYSYRPEAKLWRVPGNIHGFVLDGKSYRQGKATAQTPTVTAGSGVGMSTLLLRKCNLTTIAYCHWLGWSSQTLILSISAFGAIPKHQQQQDELLTYSHYRNTPFWRLYIDFLHRIYFYYWSAHFWRYFIDFLDKVI